MKKRTKLMDRELPAYTRGEEIMNMITHIVGGAFAIAALALCVVFSALHKNVWAVVGSSIYGFTMIALYTVSSTYHGLIRPKAKRVMQIIDHCTIFLLISGTYTPILLSAIRPIDPVACWVVFGVEWGVTFIAAALNAIDLKKYSVFSMICYIAMGWCIIAILPQTIKALTMAGFCWILGGGIVYTIGAVLYVVGKKKRYIHSVFHIFVVIASLLQFFGIFFYVI